MSEAPEQANIAYCAGRDVAVRPMADAALLPFDIWQNRAHVAMLTTAGVISIPHARKIFRALDSLEKEFLAGTFHLDPAKEDAHTNIERYVAQKAGADAAGRIHSGRSRNDQVATVVRMYLRGRLLELAGSTAHLTQALLSAAHTHAHVTMAGYTHYQPACVTTVGHWLASHAQAMLRDLERALSTLERINVSPLGAAAGFGTSWPINRSMTARLLGFRAVQSNTTECVTNRWEMEADAVSVASFLLTHLSILSQDLIFLSLPQIAIVRIADRYVTGSSIMPQKRNPDFAEVTRAKAAMVQSLASALMGTAKGALSGYNRDTQWTKYLAMDALDEVGPAPLVFRGVIESLHIDETAASETASNHFIDAVDVADALANEAGVPFRTAYEIVSEAVRQSEAMELGHIDAGLVRKLALKAGIPAGRLKLGIGTPAVIVARKSHEGGPAPAAVRASVRAMQRQLARLEATVDLKRRQVEDAATAARRALDDLRNPVSPAGDGSGA
jgi:argininosuccinate lyase